MQWAATRFLHTLAIALAVTALATTAAYATAPGKSGRIAFRRFFDQGHHWGAVFTMNADGTSQRQITHPPEGVVDDQPDWAPNGSSIAFSRCAKKAPEQCAIYTVRPDGSGLKRVSKPCPAPRKIPPCSDDFLASFSPDGKELAFSQYVGNIASIVIVDTNTGEQHVVLPGAKDSSLQDPQFSPTGKQIVFTHVVEPKENSRALFVVNVDGTGVRRLTPWSLQAGDNPDWSPDGKWVLFRSFEDVDNRQSQIYLIHPDGSGLKQLTNYKKGSIVTSSSFSPDGKWIVYGSTGVGGNADLFLMRPDGSDKHPITRTKLWDSAPDWGPAP